MPCDLIACDGCSRSFTTENAPEMLAAIKGPCPTCGGTFRLAALAGAAGPSTNPPAPGPARAP